MMARKMKDTDSEEEIRGNFLCLTAEIIVVVTNKFHRSFQGL